MCLGNTLQALPSSEVPGYSNTAKATINNAGLIQSEPWQFQSNIYLFIDGL